MAVKKSEIAAARVQVALAKRRKQTITPEIVDLANTPMREANNVDSLPTSHLER